MIDFKMKITTRIIIGLCSIAIFTLGSSAVVHAEPMSNGFFTGWSYSGTGNGTSVLPKDFDSYLGAKSIAIPTYVNSVDELINFLQGYNSIFSPVQQRTGAAFIVCTMLGKTFQTCKDVAYINDSRTVSQDGWDELSTRLNSPNLTIDWGINYNGTFEFATYNNFRNTLYDKINHDNYFFTKDVETNPIITFTQKDFGVVYRLFRSCANPIGDLWGLFPYKINKWSVTPTTSVNHITAKPGDVIKWTHQVKNDGQDATTENVYYYYQNGGDLGIGEDSHNDHWLPADSFKGETYSYKSKKYTVRASDVGKKLCRRTWAVPRSWDRSSAIPSKYACVDIPYDFSLHPYVTLNPDAIEAGARVIATPSVDNTGNTVSTKSAWKLTRTVYSPSETIKESGYVSSGTGVTFGLGSTKLPPYSDPNTYEPPGSKICFVLSVHSKSETDSEQVESSHECVVIGKKPKVQVWGGDLVVGGKVMTSTYVKDNTTFGSWAEYGIIAGGNITGAGSNSAFADLGMLSASNCQAGRLSFTNTPLVVARCTGAKGSIGNYTNAHHIPDVEASFPGGSYIITNSTEIPANLSSSTYRTGNITLDTSELTPGQSIIIKAAGAVKIIGNQTYDRGPYTKVSQLPQLVIIANKIIIHSEVTRVDAWLIAKGTDGYIRTCELSGHTIDMCNNKLVVNGPVMANKLYLQRTAGSEVDVGGNNPDKPGRPAEIFNLRADAYLWAASRASSNGRIRSVYTTELPPRL